VTKKPWESSMKPQEHEASQSPEDSPLTADPTETGTLASTQAEVDATGKTASQGSGPILSESLFRGRSEVQILHRGELYRLCLTRAGKLILHK
jgi:hemin uptake protein HemP